MVCEAPLVELVEVVWDEMLMVVPLERGIDVETPTTAEVMVALLGVIEAVRNV